MRAGFLLAVVLALPAACGSSGPGGSPVSTGTIPVTTTSTTTLTPTSTGTSSTTTTAATPTTAPLPAASPEAALVAYVRPGFRYVGACDRADASTDVGAYCSKLLDDRGSTRIYVIGLTFSEFDTFLRLDQVAGGWVVGAVAPVTETTGMEPPWPAPTTTAATTPCPPFGSTARVASASDDVFSLVGAEVRAGRHECYERVVFEMRGDGPFPSWSVAELDGPFDNPDGPRLDAGARLRVWIAAANVIADPSSALGYTLAWTLQGSSAPSAKAEWPGYVALQGVVFGSGGDEKDSSTFTVGLDRVRPFRVSTLRDPARLVVDVYVPR